MTRQIAVKLAFVRAVLKHDLPASLVVFLIAIPLSLGIAAVSGAPLIAGLVAAVVSSVVAGAFGGAPLLVSGPAVSLTVIVAGLVADYGWAATAAITVAAGLVQIMLGITRVGRAALSLSPAVVQGMLAGLGAIIVLSQLHVVLGGTPQSSALANLRDLPRQVMSHHSHAAMVGIISIALLLIWPRLPKVSVVPAPLIAVVVGAVIVAATGFDVPTVSLPDDPIGALVFPAMPHGEWSKIVIAVLTVAMVASVESLLSAVALDRLHDGPRANLDRELAAQGLANMASGALGGMPVAGAIVRSSASVKVGAKSRAANMLHGLWVAVFVIAAGALLEQIPLASLAAILIMVGSSLISVQHIKTLRLHRELAVYVITFAGVLCLNLVEGALIGIGAAVARALYRLTHCPIRSSQTGPNRWTVVVHGSLTFLAVSRLVKTLREVPQGQHVTLELHLDYLDHAAFEALQDWQVSYIRMGGGVHVEETHGDWFERAKAGEPGDRKSLPRRLPRWMTPWSHWQHDNPESTAGSDDSPAAITPMLLGMHEFSQRGAPAIRSYLAELADGQRPQQLFVTCADSRIVPNMITASGPGDLFCVRNVGNLIPPSGADDSIGASIEFAVDVLGVRVLTVCGHSDCGAMKAALSRHTVDDSALSRWLRHCEPTEKQLRAQRDTASGEETTVSRLEQFTIANVLQQLENARSYPSVAHALDEGRLELAGIYFDIRAAQMRLIAPGDGKGIGSTIEPVG
ncbi:MAG TPA: bifunctional SulP family inorganic anion transporter/carbonic anhydrase [Mycobacteriales bacterium]|nr:bifunctional SulP family inorganic anion transporter/carbonic anhydrase [Mycobacteriales bacterium]